MANKAVLLSFAIVASDNSNVPGVLRVLSDVNHWLLRRIHMIQFKQLQDVLKITRLMLPRFAASACQGKRVVAQSILMNNS